MHDAIRVGRAASALAALSSILLQGCAHNSSLTASDDLTNSIDTSAPWYTGSVSAREYGYVRPSRDGQGRDGKRFVATGRGGDVWSRVRSGMKLNLHANYRIDSTLASFKRDPRYLDKMSQRASPYLPVITSEIERRGLPMELALLPHVESRYNPAATSPKAAAGMWQFMPYTAREMGLRLDGDYDGRRDVVASTRAAMDYLQQLHRRFGGDWELAMAAYNCGPKRVASAQEANRRDGRPTDFWSLDLPDETRQYVPQILAAARLVAESRGSAQRVPVAPATPGADRIEIIRTSTDRDLVKAAVAKGVPFSELQRLNPGIDLFRSDTGRITQLKVPAGTGAKLAKTALDISVMPLTASAASAQVAVRLRERQPSSIAGRGADDRVHLVKNGDTLASVALRYSVDTKSLADANGMSSYDPLLPGQSLQIPRKEALDVITHKVRQGDSIGTIARLYGVTVADIQRWNHIADNRLNPGAVLRIYRRDAGSST